MVSIPRYKDVNNHNGPFRRELNSILFVKNINAYFVASLELTPESSKHL